MKTLLFIAIYPLLVFSDETNIQFHLPCEVGDICGRFETNGSEVSLKKDTEMVLNRENLLSADVGEDEFGRPELVLKLKPNARAQFALVTEKAIGKSIAIVIGTKIISQAQVHEKIDTDGVRLTNGSDN